MFLKEINNRKEQRLDVLEELIKNVHNNMSEALGIIEEIRYLDFLKKNINKQN